MTVTTIKGDFYELPTVVSAVTRKLVKLDEASELSYDLEEFAPYIDEDMGFERVNKLIGSMEEFSRARLRTLLQNGFYDDVETAIEMYYNDTIIENEDIVKATDEAILSVLSLPEDSPVLIYIDRDRVIRDYGIQIGTNAVCYSS